MEAELRCKWIQKFMQLEADGVDFISTLPINYDDPSKNIVAASFTRADFFTLQECSYPRLPYVFWKILFGEKCYINETNKN